MQAPVFISYPRDHSLGQLWAERIDDHLSQSIRCWRDVNDIKSAAFSEAIQTGIEQCDVMLVVLSRQTINSDWVPNEVNHAKLHKKPIVVVLVEQGAETLFSINHLNPLPIAEANNNADWELLRSELSLHVGPLLPTQKLSTLTDIQRNEELEWLSELCYQEYANFDQLYEPLQAQQIQGDRLQQRLPTTVAHSSLTLSRFSKEEHRLQSPQEHRSSIERFDDVIEAFTALAGREHAQVALLGEPGAGKTFSLKRLALMLAKEAKEDKHKPLPLLVSLKYWTKPSETLENFLSRALGNQGMGRHWRKLLDQKRAFLMLDAINELPSQQRAEKAELLRKFVSDERWQGVVVSCRLDDFEQGFRLPMDRLELQPLSPVQVHDFVVRYFADDSEKAQNCFWRIAGGKHLQRAFAELQTHGVTLDNFWSGMDLSKHFDKIHHWSSENQMCIKARADARGLIKLAANPYLLDLMVQAYNEHGELPETRSQLFAAVVDTLIDREVSICEQRGDAPPDAEQLKKALQTLAMQMQRNSLNGEDASEGAQISLSVMHCPAVLSAQIRQQATSASLLIESDSQISFSHQLMQEYFASDGLWQLIENTGLAASELWPSDSWWLRNGWEVTLELLLEQLHEHQQAVVLRWLGGANGDLASALWLKFEKASMDRDWLANYQRHWLPRITDVHAEPKPQARAAAARALGRWGLDSRKGVGLNTDGLPDIDWVNINDEPFYYQDEDQPRTLPAFAISRYLVTNAQYQSFVDDGGYTDDCWWVGLANRYEAPAESVWTEPNSPRESVSWYEAVAFCRWLSARTALEISLPTEYQFERVARGPNWRPETQKVDYPWRGEWDSALVNSESNLGQTSAVGVYAASQSIEGLHDLSGNLWEWQLNTLDNPNDRVIEGDSARALRGGSWYFNADNCRSSFRYHYDPDRRYDLIGFRLSCLSPI